MELIKEDLKKAFKQGDSYGYSMTQNTCFNRWYNENYLDMEKCKTCKFFEKKYYKTCLSCKEFSNYKVIGE